MEPQQNRQQRISDLEAAGLFADESAKHLWKAFLYGRMWLTSLLRFAATPTLKRFGWYRL